MTQGIEIRMGALAPSLVEQLAPHGVSHEAAEYFDQLSTAITDLLLAGVLPDAQGKKCRERLFKQIDKELHRKKLQSAGAQP